MSCSRAFLAFLTAFALSTSVSVQAASPVVSGQTSSDGAVAVPSASSETANDVLLNAMNKELQRSFKKLKNAGSAPLYFLGYRVFDVEDYNLRASYGALERDDHDKRRILDVEARVGNMEVDNTHKLRGRFGFASDAIVSDISSSGEFSLDNDEGAIRNALWLSTDGAYKRAQRTYIEVKANKDVKVEEEDKSPDFSATKPVVSIQTEPRPTIDVKGWRDRLRRLSAIYRNYPEITESAVGLDYDFIERYIVTSEGTIVKTCDQVGHVSTTVSAIADDGMILSLYDSIDVLNAKDFPDEKTVEQRIKKLAESIMVLRKAPHAEPYVGPAIVRNRAAGVFFHEVLGHRVEGHRQKDENEGRTFTKKVNQLILPKFISVSDDPTIQFIRNKQLMGFYKYDNEGVPAERVSVVDRGVLKNFLMSRSPINQFNQSNGHARGSPGADPVARQGNLIIESTKQVPYEKLRAMLISEAKRQGKKYGLIFDEIAGGFAITQAFMPQSFQLLPLRVTRVWTDGRPDELLRGVNLVGTPLASLETILMAGDDVDTFNGVCGAESGWVPVSATAPSLLVKTVEVAREWKDQDTPPILPPPLFDKHKPAEK